MTLANHSERRTAAIQNAVEYRAQRIKRILIPIIGVNGEAPAARQIGLLARQFGSEIILLHVRPPRGLRDTLALSRPFYGRDLTRPTIERDSHELHGTLETEFRELRIVPLLVEGDPARELLRTAQERSADLIVMSLGKHRSARDRLLPTIEREVLRQSPCPIWFHVTGDPPVRGDRAIRNVLCALDLTPHSRQTLARAHHFAVACDASLRLVHVTESVESWGPGGWHVDPEWRATLVGAAAREIANLQRDVGSCAPVVIESGNVHKRIAQVATTSQSDLLIVGRIPPGGHIGQNGGGYALVRDSAIPVLSV